jgi:hypothetical protein
MHGLTADDLCDYQILFLVLVDFDFLLEENMILDPKSDVIERLFTVGPEIIKGGVDQVHIIQEGAVDFLDDLFELS